MRFCRIYTVGAAFADVGLADDECGLGGRLFGLGNGGIYCINIVPVDGANHVPLVGFKAFGSVIAKPGRNLPVNADAVIVIQGNKLVELPCACQGAGFMADTFHQAAVAHKYISVVVEHFHLGAVELSSQQFFCQRHANRITNTLPQRASGSFYARGNAHFGVASGFAVQLAEVLQLAHWQVIASQMQQRVQQHGAVAVAQHKTIAVIPLWVCRIVAQMAAPQGYGHFSHAHRSSRMARVGFLNSIHSQCANCIGHG